MEDLERGNEQQTLAQMVQALQTMCRTQLVQILCDKNTDPHQHYSVNMSLVSLSSKDSKLAMFFTSSPIYALKLFDQALLKIQDSIIHTSGVPNLFFKKANVHLRLYIFPSMLPPSTNSSVDLTNSEDNFAKSEKKSKRFSSSGITPLKSFASSVYDVSRANDVGHWRMFKGTVVRTSERQVLRFAKDYQCSKCLGVWRVECTREAFNSIEKPIKCCSKKSTVDCKNSQILDLDVVNPISSNNGGIGGNLNGENPMSLLNENSTNNRLEFMNFFNNSNTSQKQTTVRDYQEIKVQEAVDRISVGTVPKTIIIILENDLVDSLKPGEDVLICGITVQRFKFMKPNEKVDGQVVILANHVKSLNQDKTRALEITEELRDDFVEYWKYWRNVRKDPIQGRDTIIQSFANNIYGMAFVKLAIILVLVGGIEKYQDRMKIRGDIHLLLVGDPGTGKSQFLKSAYQIASRSIFTTGIGSTSAGLTCAAVREGGEWHLDAGALVLADRGLCCIDEFSSIGEGEKTAIHEAMEQQTVSVAKAGIVTTLNTRCSILAATNPKGNYDSASGLSLNLGIASPLLSRFDLVMVLLDRHNEEWDNAVSDFILNKECEMDEPVNSEFEDSNKSKLFSEIDNENGDSALRERYGNGFWTNEKLRSYITFCKNEKNPQLTDDASLILKSYYQSQRQSDLRNAGRTTIRLLESLIRLSQAHAKLMLQDFVTADDAIIVVRLMDASFQSTALVDNMVISPLHTPFPKIPSADHSQWCLKITRVLHPDLYNKLKLRKDKLESKTNDNKISSQMHDKNGDDNQSITNTRTATPSTNTSVIDGNSSLLSGKSSLSRFAYNKNNKNELDENNEIQEDESDDYEPSFNSKRLKLNQLNSDKDISHLQVSMTASNIEDAEDAADLIFTNRHRLDSSLPNNLERNIPANTQHFSQTLLINQFDDSFSFEKDNSIIENNENNNANLALLTRKSHPMEDLQPPTDSPPVLDDFSMV